MIREKIRSGLLLTASLLILFPTYLRAENDILSVWEESDEEDQFESFSENIPAPVSPASTMTEAIQADSPADPVDTDFYICSANVVYIISRVSRGLPRDDDFLLFV